MSEEKLKVGVVGVGSLGQWHARVYSELETAELAGVYDTDEKRAREIAKRYRTRAFESLESLAENIAAASVVVPTASHARVANELIGRGIHLLVEKPIAATTAEAEEIVAAAERRGTILQVGHVERFNPVMEYLEGIATRPRFIEAHRLSPYPVSDGGRPRGTDVSVVLDLMIHDLEVILNLVRSDVTHIHAVGIPVLSESEDIANARLSFDGGCVANVTASRVSPEGMRKIRVFQENAYISLDYKNQVGEIYTKDGMKIERSKVPINKGEPLFNELAAFVECARAHGSPRVGGRQATEALSLAARIIRQMREESS